MEGHDIRNKNDNQPSKLLTRHMGFFLGRKKNLQKQVQENRASKQGRKYKKLRK